MKKTITKEFAFDMAHRLYDSNLNYMENLAIFGKCFNLHGHTYKLFVTISGELKHGMMINFTELKKIVTKNALDIYDHKTLLTKGDPLCDVIKEHAVIMNDPSTCENQVDLIWDLLVDDLLMHNIELEEIKLYETPTSYAVLRK